jgi:diguanylate cyclase (GGDEF)-like protein/PAS domain S-box-containing protein
VALFPLFGSGLGGTRTSWILQTALDVLLAVISLRLALVTAGQRHPRRFWRAAAFAGLACTVGDLFQTVHVLLRPGDTDTSLFQTGCVVVGMVTVVIVTLFHPLGGTGRQRLRLWLDAFTVLTAVAVFLWYFSLSTALTSGDTGHTYGVAAVSAVMLLIAFGMLTLVLGNTAPFTFGAGVIGIIGLSGTAVSASVTPILFGSSDPRAMFIAALLPCVLITAAVRIQELQMRRLRVQPVNKRHGSSRMPYLAVVCTQILLIAALAGDGPRVRVWGVAAGAVLITFLVLGRQLAAFQDNERLLEQLDHSMLEMDSQREWFRSLVQHSSDVTVVLGQDGRIRYASPASHRVLGVDAEALEGTLLADRTHPADLHLLLGLADKIAAVPGTDADAQLRIRHADGSDRWLDIVGVDLRGNPSVNGIVLNARDITEARALHDELRHQATHDSLTGLANRTLLDQHLRRLPADAQVGMLLVDLDGFKPINDHNGHHAGDQVLKAVADRLTCLVGESGLAARVGGDEFAVLLPRVTETAAEALAELIAEAVAAPITLSGAPSGEDVAVGASVGVAVGLPHESDRLHRDADAAMYRRKAERKALSR